MNRWDDIVKVALPATHTTGVLLGQLLATLCQQLTTSADTESFQHQVISAFQEAYNNIIIHAYQGKEGEPIEVSFAVQEGALRLALSDQGTPLPSQQPVDTLLNFADYPIDQLPEGGMGLSIINACMDRVTYEHNEGHNQIKMIKYFQTPGAPPP